MTLLSFDSRHLRRAAWQLVVAVLLLAKTSGAEATVVFDPPAAVDAGASDAGIDTNAKIATDGAGHWVAVWQFRNPSGGATGSDYDIFVARSLDNGATWTAPAALNTNAATDAGHDTFPALATDGAGHWTAMWRSNDSLGGTIGPDDELLVARSTDNGALWTAPVALNTNAAIDTAGDFDPNVTTDGAGHWIAAWSSINAPTGQGETPDADILVARSTDNGAVWTAPSALNTNAASDAGNDQSPSVTTDGNGHWVAVWESNDSLESTVGADFEIFVARSADNGVTWTAPAALNTNAEADVGNDLDPQVTTDGAGHWVVVWGLSSGTGPVGSDADILVALSQDNGATWTEPAALNSNAASDTAADLAPYVTTDRQGRWVAIWSSLEASASAHTNILSAQSTDDGVTWTVPVTINPDSSGDRDFANHVTADGSGHWVVLLQSDDSVGDTVDFDLVASRGSEPLPTPTPTVSLPPAMTATPTRSSTPTVSPPTTPTATPTALPTRTPAAPPVLGKAVRACLTALAVQARTFAVTEHKLIQKCLDQLLTDTAAGKGTVRAIAACLKTLDRTRLDSALARAQASATGKIAKKCTGVLPNEIANPCDAEAPTLAATATCVLAMYAASVEEQIAASYADACTLIATVGIEDQLPRLCSQP